MKRAFLMRGGPHDGVRLDPSVRDRIGTALCDRLDDAANRYARAGHQTMDADGTVREIFEFDATRSLIDVARRRFASQTLDDAPHR